MNTIREPAVAGTFYPNDPAVLTSMIDSYLAGDNEVTECPKAIIAPHAGYVYSGPIAGRVYRDIAAGRGQVSRVVLMGPSHRVAFRGMALPTASAFRTPIGDIPLDQPLMASLLDLASVQAIDQAHAQEHSLEVHLPFLQQVLGDFSLVPIVVGDTAPEEVAELLENVWGGDETLIVVSSDLSHYQSYESAMATDGRTRAKIEQLSPSLKGEEACGCRPVNGLLKFLKDHGLTIETVDVRNSGDTAGDRSRVVGYGAWRVMQGKRNTTASEWNLAERQMLLQLAREAIRSPLEGEKQFNIQLERFPDHLKDKRASFVTINLDGNLRGCIGSLEAHRPLVLDVAHNAQAAAFKDPRFSQLTHGEYQRIDLHISVLSAPLALSVSSRDELIAELQPGTHGLIIEENGRRATYLPSVWSQLKDPETFVSELRRKAGLDPLGWDAATKVYTYVTEEFC